MKSSDFWKSQPTKTGEGQEGVINIPKDKTPQKTKLPEKYSWKNVDDVKTVADFLKENYIDNEEIDASLIFTRESIYKLFNAPTHRNEYSIAIYSANEMIGYIYGKEQRISINGKKERILSVNFLCLQKQHRNKSLAPLLIQELKRVAYNNQIYSGVFVGKENKGFCFTEAVYYHLPLNIEKLSKMIYLPEKYATVEFKRRKETVLPKEEDYKKMYSIYQREKDHYEFFETFEFEEFKYAMKPFKNSNYTLYNSSTGEFVSFFVVETAIHKTLQKIRKAYLYYWVGTEKILEDAFSYAKDELNLDMFDALNLAKNEIMAIGKFPFLEGTGHLFYHMFNYSSSIKSRSRTNFILI
ncbi:hypothetical protein NUSPORA_01767 [Nucleospora cyclopteri]